MPKGADFSEYCRRATLTTRENADQNAIF